MSSTAPQVNKTTKLYQNVAPLSSTILGGMLLAIDPSTGSRSSMPGYALFDKGELVESGIIQVRVQDRKNIRLYNIAETLRTEFPKIDILAVENIPPVSYNRKGAMRGWSLVALQRSIGAIISCFDCDYVEVAPTWTTKFRPEELDKDDEADAIGIGNATLQAARQAVEELGNG